MKYISKGMVIKASTEELLFVTRHGTDFQLTDLQAELWLNGRYGFAESGGNILEEKALAEMAAIRKTGTAHVVPVFSLLRNPSLSFRGGQSCAIECCRGRRLCRPCRWPGCLSLGRTESSAPTNGLSVVRPPRDGRNGCCIRA